MLRFLDDSKWIRSFAIPVHPMRLWFTVLATTKSRLMGTAIHSSTPRPIRRLHYPASTQASRAIVLQRDNQDPTMVHDGTRGFDILFCQQMIDSGLVAQAASLCS